MLVTQIPDFIGLYADHTMHRYVDKYCTKEQRNAEKCYFGMYYDPYVREHKTLNKMSSYFLMGYGPLYWALSGRCSNQTFHNPSAAPKSSGKITNRQYFFSHCSEATDALSDLIFKDGDKERFPTLEDDSL